MLTEERVNELIRQGVEDHEYRFTQQGIRLGLVVLTLCLFILSALFVQDYRLLTMLR